MRRAGIGMKRWCNSWAGHADDFDLGKMLERITSRDSNETAVRKAIDDVIWAVNDAYQSHQQGGAYEVFTDPHTDAPLIEDIPIGSAGCALYHP